MAKEFWTFSEVIQLFQVEERFLLDLEAEEIVCPTCRGSANDKVFDDGDLEKLRLAKILVEEMDVNLPGVEIIIRMRQTLFDMRRQFDAILEDLARRFEKARKDLESY